MDFSLAVSDFQGSLRWEIEFFLPVSDTSRASDANLAPNPVLGLASLTSQQPNLSVARVGGSTPSSRGATWLESGCVDTPLSAIHPTHHLHKCHLPDQNKQHGRLPGSGPYQKPIQTPNWKNRTGMNQLSVELIYGFFPPRKPAHFVCLSVSATSAAAGRARPGDQETRRPGDRVTGRPGDQETR